MPGTKRNQRKYNPARAAGSRPKNETEKGSGLHKLPTQLRSQGAIAKGSANVATRTGLTTRSTNKKKERPEPLSRCKNPGKTPKHAKSIRSGVKNRHYRGRKPHLKRKPPASKCQRRSSHGEKPGTTKMKKRTLRKQIRDRKKRMGPM